MAVEPGCSRARILKAVRGLEPDVHERVFIRVAMPLPNMAIET
jgi:hypothetical protein